MSYSTKIQEFRVNRGMTHQQFGDAVGVSRGAVQQWEKGVTAPTRKNQPVVAKMLGITVAELMGDHDHSPDAAKPEVTPMPTRAPTAAPEPNLAGALRVIAEALMPLDATALRRASGLLADLGNEPEQHASLALLLAQVVASGKRRAA